ncbi:unnamed protein product [Effrenium voratum]|nr:unnamed protein product [Effrenium voratum]
MGALLAGPATQKDSGDGRSLSNGLEWGYSAMQGWRDRMEDAHLAIGSLSSTFSWQETSFFAVMDGHGGEHVAQFCRHHLPSELMQYRGQDLGDALVRAFHRMDERLLETSPEELKSMGHGAFKNWANPDLMGCTAVAAVVRPEVIVVANAGDSRAVLCRGGKAIDMSEDHKPNNPVELQRILKAGGAVLQQHLGNHVHYRVNGNLNLSRSIGDLLYKQNANLTAQEQVIVCHPDVRYFPRQADDEFMILACDGVWDVLSSQEAVDFVRMRLGSFRDLAFRLQEGRLRLSSIIEEMLDACLSPDLAQTMGLGGDNMTAVLVVFTASRQAGWLDSSVVPAASWMCPYR